MNICIDGFGITALRGTGNYTYTKNLILGLLEQHPQPKYSLICDKDIVCETWKNSCNFACVDIQMNRKTNDLKKLEQYLIDEKVSLYHSPNNGFSIPEKKVCKYIITIHDLVAKTHPELVDEIYKMKFEQVFLQAAKKADKIIAVSNFIKWELVNYFEIDTEKIEVIYPWYEGAETLDIEHSKEVLRNKYNVDCKFILSIGSIHPRKNFLMLLRAFKAANFQNEGLKLIIVGGIHGKRHNHYLELMEMIEKMGLSNSVIFTGAVDHNDVPYFYKCANCMVSLSEYEGFPQVCLEAMTFGTPIICGNNSSFGEVVGSAAYYVNLKDMNQIMQTLRQVVFNRDENKIATGLGRSSNFTLNECIKKIVRVYEKALY